MNALLEYLRAVRLAAFWIGLGVSIVGVIIVIAFAIVWIGQHYPVQALIALPIIGFLCAVEIARIHLDNEKRL